ncbi:hypothetical protein GCM10027612_34540 [Microbispora bryophytorum subsp. camponoti]
MAVAGLGAMAATAGCGGARVTPEGYTSSTPSLSWKACEETASSSGFECATLQVPLDYAKPEGKKIGIALVRLRATDQSRRIGSWSSTSAVPAAPASRRSSTRPTRSPL